MIRYEQSAPITGEPLTIGQMSEDYFVLCMSRAFPDRNPLVLDKADIPILTGMSACWSETALNPYLQIINVIKKLGSVRVWQTNEKKKGEGKSKPPLEEESTATLGRSPDDQQ